MTNEEIAAIFEQISLRMELTDADSFRIRAYRRAAELASTYHESLAQLAASGGLNTVAGVGKSIERDIQQLLQRGTCDVLEELRQLIPEGLLDLLQVQGLGPKRIRMLWQELGITNLDLLRQEAMAGRIATLKGLGAKTQASILRELERIERMQGRTLYAMALPLAMMLRRDLAARPDVERAEVAGSLRRGAETVGDLDLVVTAKGDPQPIMDAFVAHQEVAEVIAHGPSKSSVRLRGDIQADLRVVKPEQWGSAIHHFTGSYQHHILLRARAKTLGLKINEYGVFRGDEPMPIAGHDEASVYAALGLPWIPPELREGRGEIEAALDGKLPCLVEQKDIRGDVHMHTTASDGIATVAEMAEEAKRLGYEYICITDHSQAMTIANGLTPERLRHHMEHIREVATRTKGIRILAGIEVDILKDGALDLPENLLEALDFVVASVHTGFAMGERAMTERIVRAIRSGVVNVIGHPTGRLLGSRDAYAFDIETVLDAASECGVAMEINASPNRLDFNDVHCRMVREAGVKVVINSDAHSIAGLHLLSLGMNMARRGWLRRSDVLNCLPLAEFLAAIA